MEGQENSIPEYYSDSFKFTISPYGIAMTFGINPPHPALGQVTPPKDSFILRMSLEQAKVLAMLLRRQLKNYELQNNLEISLPVQVYTQLGIAKEDWGS